MPIYKIKASVFRIAYTLMCCFAIQLGCFKYIEYEDYITFIFCIAVLVMIGTFIYSILIIFFLIKKGRPSITFDEAGCEFKLLFIECKFKYSQMQSFSLSKQERSSRIYTIYERHLTLYFDKKIDVHYLLRKKMQTESTFSLQQLNFISSKQVMQIAMLLMIIRNTKPPQRVNLIQKLNQKPFDFSQFISQKNIAHFKSDQYLSKNFKVEQ